MAEFTLDNKNKKTADVLKVNIGNDTYSIPLAGALSIKELKMTQTTMGVIDFFEKYIPEDVFDTLTVDDLNEIVGAWFKATQDETGATPGES